jgi:hypothetical protein
VRLAAIHLNDPVATVQGLYARQDPVKSWESDTTKRFGVELEEDRLSVGTVRYDPGQPGLVFAVAKGI